MITIVSTTQGPGHGAEVVLAELLRAWSAERPALVVLAPPGSAAAGAASATGLRWVPLQTSRDSLLANVAAGHTVTTRLRECRLVHAWTARGLELSWWMGRRLGVPATATLHDHPDTSAETWARRRLWRRSANLQDGVVMPSAALQAAWRAAGLRRPSRVIPNGLRALTPAPRDPASRGVTIGFLGMYAPWKGFDVARAWARAGWPGHVVWRFYGAVHEALRGAAAALEAELGTRVSFEGPQPRERVFGAVDVLVHCSTAFDPLPTVLIEAAQAGVPAVASSLGGAAEIVEHGRTGFLFDPAAPDAGLAHLRGLVEDAALRSRLGTAARERYGRLFRIERMVEGYAGFWGEATAGEVSA